MQLIDSYYSSVSDFEARSNNGLFSVTGLISMMI